MIHYTLMQSPVPKAYLTEFMQACYSNIEYFIDAESLLGSGIHGFLEVNTVFNLKDPQFKTILLNVNPYKRIVLSYIAEMQESGTTIPFVEFLVELKDPASYYSQLGIAENIAPHIIAAAAESITPSYVLEFDTFETDIRSIPEFAEVADVEFLRKAQDAIKVLPSLYNDEAKALVEEIFKDDIEYFGYTFPG